MHQAGQSREAVTAWCQPALGLAWTASDSEQHPALDLPELPGVGALAEGCLHYTLVLPSSRIPRSWDPLAGLPDSGVLLLTVEYRGSAALTGSDPVRELREGKADEVIRELGRAVNRREQPVLLRFQPEMEVPSNRYPWQNQGRWWIEAYRHWAQTLRQEAPNAGLVWGPAGYPGALEYYPGTTSATGSALRCKAPPSVNWTLTRLIAMRAKR